MRPWDLRVISSSILLSSAVALVAGCSLEKRDDIAELPWTCSQATACGCERIKPNVAHGGNSVEQCSAFDCCVYDKTQTEFAFETCDCFDTESSCETEAQNRGGEVVDSCPPGTTRPPTCAEDAEPCDAPYLSEHALDGCCDGLVCQPSSEGVWACRAGSADEIALANECAQTSADSNLEGFELLTPTLRTSLGDFQLIDVSSLAPGIGPLGCLNRISLDFEATGIDCTIRLAARETGGKLVTTSFDASLGDCEGYVGEPDPYHFTYIENPPFEITFEGLACDASSYSERYCTVGIIDWHLHGTFEDVSFEEQHLKVRARICEYAYGDCPSP